MLFHARKGEGIQCDSGRGDCGGAGNRNFVFCVTRECHRQHDASAWLSPSTALHSRECTARYSGGLQQMPEGKPGGRKILLRLRERAVAVTVRSYEINPN